jgi:hypothetical protein
MSMHVYENDIPRADEILAGVDAAVSSPMLQMPQNPIETINNLTKLEAELRHSGHLINDATIDNWISNADKLGPYWSQFFLVLLFHHANKISRDAAKAVRDQIPAPFLDFMPAATGPKQDNAPFELGEPRTRPAADVLLLQSRRMRSVRQQIERLESVGQPLSAATMWDLQEHFLRLAARFGYDAEISEVDFLRALEAARKGR